MARWFRSFRLCKRIALAAAFVAGTAHAAEPTAPAVAAWVAENTDLQPSQIALITAELVYSLESLGPRSSTDEVVALARTEVINGDVTAGGVQSWDAHLLFDCQGRRVRVIRSADYRQRNRKGPPVATTELGNWLSPSPDQPAALLVAAACDAAFAWPLRTPIAPVAPSVLAQADPVPPALPVVEAMVREAPVVERPARPDAPPPAAASQPGFSIQIARGPSAEGALKALRAARKALGSTGAGLAATTEHSRVGRQSRYTVALSGFPSATAASEACDKLHAVDQHCFVRAAHGDQDVADREQAGAAPAPPAVAAVAAGPAPAEASLQGYVIQLAYGPSEEGASRAVQRARKVLGGEATNLKSATETSRRGDRMRYTALLGGFETAAAALSACDTLQKARLTCFARPAQPAG